MDFYFHAKYPMFIEEMNLKLSALEMLAIVVCLHLWSKLFKHKRIVVQCDNLSVCLILKIGEFKCIFLQK